MLFWLFFLAKPDREVGEWPFFLWKMVVIEHKGQVSNWEVPGGPDTPCPAQAGGSHLQAQPKAKGT